MIPHCDVSFTKKKTLGEITIQWFEATYGGIMRTGDVSKKK